MKVCLVTPTARFGFDLAAHLDARGLGPVRVQVDAREAFELRYRVNLPPRQVSELLDAIWPLLPDKVEAVEDPGGCDMMLVLGEPVSEVERPLRLHADSTACLDAWRKTLTGLGYRIEASELRLCEDDSLRHTGLPRLTQQKLRWYWHRQGVALQVREDSDCTTAAIFVRDPDLAARPLRGRYPVEVVCDDANATAELVGRLNERGFQALAGPVMPAADALEASIHIQTGPYHSDRAPPEAAALRATVLDFLQHAGVDVSRYAVNQEAATQTVLTRVVVPLVACKSGHKRPYSGPYPERFQVTVVTDQPDSAQGLLRRLQDARFDGVKVEHRPSLLDGPVDSSGGEFQRGFALAWNDAGNEAVIASLLRDALKAAMDEAGASEFYPRQVNSCPGGPGAVRIYFPVRGVADGSLLAKVADAGSFNIRLSSPRPDDWGDLMAEFRGWSFNRCETRETTDESSSLSFGGAPLELIEKVRATIRKHSGVDIRPNKVWSDSDCDIWFYLPARSGAAASTAGKSDDEGETKEATSEEPKLPEDLGPQLELWAFGEAEDEAQHAFLGVTGEQVRVGSVVLPRNHGPRHELAPHPSSFSHFCIDRLTALTLEHVATSALLREPCLLEGETSTSKTSSILYLAALLNQPVVRINLNGQTDTGELIGRFVPQHLILELPLTSQELYAAADLLEAETRMILEKARRENRALSRVEIQQIMAQEEMVSHPWRWEDGLVPEAMKNGWWVLLDEVNLAEPQILERLNSALEPNPTLTLTEYDNSVIGSGGTPVHADFRLFATMNPAEYAGRSVLSPAYRDRWRGYRFVPRPGEGEYLDMLRLLVYGQQPDFGLHGTAYRGGRQEPRYPQFGDLPNADAYLEALARFHVALEHAVGQGGADTVARIGSRRRERYVFTRRGLLSILEYLASPLCEANGSLEQRAVRKALLRYYLGRISTAEDRKMVVQLLDAHGIGPNTWTL